MTRTAMTTTDLADDGLPPLEWSRAEEAIAAGLLASSAPFVGTVTPDGRPHSARVGALWHDGHVYFQTGQGTRKARNLAANPACTVSAGLDGIDVVVNGEAHRVTDGETLAAVTALWREAGWPVEPDGEGGLTAPFNAPGVGPAPWHLYRVTAHSVVGVATAEPHGATKWIFETG